jgi:hypothetical protein
VTCTDGAENDSRIRSAQGGVRLVVDRGFPPQLREAEVEHLRVTRGRDDDVLGLQVAVSDSDCVGCRHRVGDLSHHLERAAEVERTSCDPVPQRLAVDELHRDEMDGLAVDGVASDLVNGHEVRMIQRRRSLCLLDEAREAIPARGDLGRQDLDRDAALERRIEGAVDGTHSTLSEKGDDSIAAEITPGQVAEGHWFGGDDTRASSSRHEPAEAVVRGLSRRAEAREELRGPAFTSSARSGRVRGSTGRRRSFGRARTGRIVARIADTLAARRTTTNRVGC